MYPGSPVLSSRTFPDLLRHASRSGVEVSPPDVPRAALTHSVRRGKVRWDMTTEEKLERVMRLCREWEAHEPPGCDAVYLLRVAVGLEPEPTPRVVLTWAEEHARIHGVKP